MTTELSTSVPEELNNLNWGAFFFTWIWGLFNNTYITLLVFVPFVGSIMPFILLFKGNEWAWKNKEWASVEEFLEVQKKWAWAGFILFIIFILIAILGSVFYTNVITNAQY